MNSYEAKRIPLGSILAQLGHDPHHEAKGEWWYFSPFREETIPSFKINQERNIWYDFGAGEGGNVLDFILNYYRLTTISEALLHLENLGGSRIEPGVSVRGSLSPEKSSDLVITRREPLGNRVLLAYLNERGITAETARPYVEEIYYTCEDKPYFALAFPNQSGGYELRNRYYKGCYSRKDISLVNSGSGADTGTVAVFEGFMDFLSALTYYGPDTFTQPALVLNAVSMRDRAIAAIQQRRAGHVSLFLDRDQSGRDLTRFFRQQLTEVSIDDASDLYAGWKDFNAFLVAHKSLRQA